MSERLWFPMIFLWISGAWRSTYIHFVALPMNRRVQKISRPWPWPEIHFGSNATAMAAMVMGHITASGRLKGHPDLTAFFLLGESSRPLGPSERRSALGPFALWNFRRTRGNSIHWVDSSSTQRLHHSTSIYTIWQFNIALYGKSPLAIGK